MLEKYEPYMHAFAILPPLVTAVVAVAADLMNNFSTLCWIAASDKYDVSLVDDTTSNKNDGQDPILSALYLTVVSMGMLNFFIIIVCMSLVCCAVQDQMTRMSRYTFRARPQGSGDPNNEVTSRTSGALGSATTGHIRRTRSNNSSTNVSATITTVGRMRSNNMLSENLDDTRAQALLYVCAFFFTYIFTTVVFIIDNFLGMEVPYPILLLQGIFQPLQGFWNFLAYIRPRYHFISSLHPEKGFLERFKMTVFQQPIPVQRERSSRGAAAVRSSIATGRRRRRRESRLRRSHNHINQTNSTRNSRTRGTSRLSRGGNDDQSKRSGVHCRKSPKRSTEYTNKDVELIKGLDGDCDCDDGGGEILNDNNIYGFAPVFDQDNEYRKDISLSMLVAHDILPETPFEFRSTNRRVSMVEMSNSNSLLSSGNNDLVDDIFDDNRDQSEDNLDLILRGDEEENLSSCTRKTSRKRRHSCPTIKPLMI